MDDWNTYSGKWPTAGRAHECIGHLIALGYTDITLTSVPFARANAAGDLTGVHEWWYQVDAIQRSANEAAFALEARRKVREIAS